MRQKKKGDHGSIKPSQLLYHRWSKATHVRHALFLQGREEPFKSLRLGTCFFIILLSKEKHIDLFYDIADEGDGENEGQTHQER